MKQLLLFMVVCSTLALPNDAFAKDLQLPPSNYKTTLYEDDFSETKMKKAWKYYKSASIIRNGVMVGITPETADHPSVNTVYIKPQADLEVTVDFKFAGSQQFNVMYRDKKCKSSHAGHICHVSVRKNKISLFDGKTGIFRKDIRDKRKAKIKLEPETKQILKTKIAQFPLKLDSDKWYTLVIRINGDVMTTYIDNKKTGELKSEGIGHQRIDQVNLTTVKKEVHYDNFAIKAR